MDEDSSDSGRERDLSDQERIVDRSVNTSNELDVYDVEYEPDDLTCDEKNDGKKKDSSSEDESEFEEADLMVVFVKDKKDKSKRINKCIYNLDRS